MRRAPSCSGCAAAFAVFRPCCRRLKRCAAAAGGWCRCSARQITGQEPLTTLQQVEPLGPKKLAQAMVIAPCTGTTLGLLAAGISSTAVTLAAKSLLRGGRPVVLAPSTNDGLAGSAPSLAAQTFLFCTLRAG